MTPDLYARVKSQTQTQAGEVVMQVIDVDSHVTVVRGLDDTPFQVSVLPDGGHLMEFDGHRLDQTPPHGKTYRPHREPIEIRKT
jgi:hypothetical protein